MTTASRAYLDRLGQALANRLVVRLGIDDAPTASEVRKALYEAILDVFGDGGAENYPNRPSLAIPAKTEAWSSGNLALSLPIRSTADRTEERL